MGKRKPETFSEADLYPPVYGFLTSAGYEVRSEVKNCDVTAVRDDELVVIELKRSFNLALVMQAVKRQKVADSVYIAIPFPAGGKFSRSWRDMIHLLRRLELGLITVRFHAESADEVAEAASVEVCLHPEPIERRKNSRLRRSILREIGGRSGDYNTGGTTRTKLVTAYRENAIHIACCLEALGPLSPARLQELGTGSKTQAILARNHYGWFERIDRGLYRLHENGASCLQEYPELCGRYREMLSDKTEREQS